MECPGSVALSDLLPPEESSEFAAEGNDAHDFAERCLNEGVDAFELMGQKGANGFECNAEMAQAVQVYVDEVRRFSNFMTLVEYRIENPELGEDFGGTADAVILADDTLHVVDLKYGVGIPVDVVGNAQLRYYAYGVLKTLKNTDHFEHVVITIVQPRAEHEDGPIRSERLTVAEVLRWGDEVMMPAMRRVAEEPDSFKSGEHCRFCPAKLICPLLRAEFHAMEKLVDNPLDNLSDAALAKQYDRIDAVDTYIRALRAEAFKRALAGNPLPGTKLIYGRSTREWNPGGEQAALDKFGEDAFTDPQVKSPAQIEKLPGGKALAAEWASKKPGKPTLVPIDKGGVTYDPKDAGAGFADVEG